MKKLFVLPWVAVLVSGCVVAPPPPPVYVAPRPYVAPYVAPPPIVVAPRPPVYVAPRPYYPYGYRPYGYYR